MEVASTVRPQFLRSHLALHRTLNLDGAINRHRPVIEPVMDGRSLDPEVPGKRRFSTHDFASSLKSLNRSTCLFAHACSLGITEAAVKVLPTTHEALPNQPMDTTEHIGHRIERRMKERGMRPAEVAAFFQIAPPSVYNWIKTGRIDNNKLPGLMRLFGGSLEWWLYGVEAEGWNAPPTHTGIVLQPSTILDLIRGVLQPLGIRFDDVVIDREAVVRRLQARLGEHDESIGSYIELTETRKPPKTIVTPTGELKREKRKRPRKVAE